MLGGNVQVGAVQSFSVKEIAGDGLGGRRVDIEAVNDVLCDFNAEGNTAQLLMSADGRIKVTVNGSVEYNTYDPDSTGVERA